MEQIIRKDRILKYKGHILDVYEDVMEGPSGKPAYWDYVEHRMCAAAVLPVLPDGRILLVRQPRPSVESISLEIPAGCRDDKNEAYIDCAARELEEEIGYSCKDLKPLISLFTTVAFCNERIEIFLAEDLQPGTQHLDPNEVIEVESYTLDEAVDMVFSGTIMDSKTIAAIMSYKALKEK